MRTTGPPNPTRLRGLDIGSQREGDHESVAIELATGYGWPPAARPDPRRAAQLRSLNETPGSCFGAVDADHGLVSSGRHQENPAFAALGASR